MNYPLTLTFKLLSIGSRLSVREANGNLIAFVKPKRFKLKEDINVFADEDQSRLLFNIKADRVIDFSPRYNFTDASGGFLGSIKRHGMRSLWKTNYQISDANDRRVLEIHEENAWTKVIDSLVGEIPVVGMFTGYMFHPAYIVSRADNTPVVRLQKQPAFFESQFQVSSQAPLSHGEESLILLGIVTMTLFERARG